uniref:BACK domain-containing protein n=1 Tax=Panagrolaimus davidi TaxID=227884 RepID=A0A914PW59_9BILA
MEMRIELKALLHLSHMYDVEYLFETCVNDILNFGTDLFKFAEIGLLYENKYDIVNKCFNAVTNFAPFLPLKCYKQNDQTNWCSSELVLLFVKNCRRTEKFTENDVFQKVFEWIKGQCEDRNLEINARNLKEIFAQFEPFICFEKMDIKILTSTVCEYKLIPEERILKCYHNHIIKEEEVKLPNASNAFSFGAHVGHMPPRSEYSPLNHPPYMIQPSMPSTSVVYRHPHQKQLQPSQPPPLFRNPSRFMLQ